ncbi:MAG: DUF4139 domain-containing protein [Alphaproteobacteria bacterium]|nr:DUF4139 domain-containing protein [Alphaproteobacteria bacterium]
MRLKMVLMLCICAFALNARAQEQPLSKDLQISIYNNDLALVRDVRSIDFKQGLNDVAFVGVASELKPESVLIMGERINVLEQNYDYALLTPYNITEKFVGQNVKTVRVNPQTGEQIFDKAKLVSFQNGQPVLLFDYGIETNFDGRLVFDKLPKDLRQKPTLAAKISSVQSELKDIMLAYLTKGISWKTNYVAGVKDENKLDLTGWVTIVNNSGVAYENAKVQLIAGDVNEVRSYGAMPRNGMVMMKAMAVSADGASFETAMPEQESFSAYQLYTLPNRTSISDNQTKQLALLEQNNVAYQKEGRLNSMLYFNGDYASAFEKLHPAIYYILKNDKESNLGLPLPKGVMRFYENDSKGNLQFIGEGAIGQTAKGEKIELKIGDMFDVFVDGKVQKVRKVSEKVIKDEQGKCPRYQIVRAYDTEVVFHNGGDKNALVVFKQNLPPQTKILDENIKGSVTEKNVNEYEWRIELKADENITLSFTAEGSMEETRCH